MAGEKILNIDDSPTVQRLIEMILASQGYEVILASDGEEGIAKARAERPALILVDFVMPKMNGFQVCKTLKDDPRLKDTPIILVTSKGDKVGSKFVDVLGITEYFTKPFQPEELLAKIREVLGKKPEPARKPVAAAAASVPPPTAQPILPRPSVAAEAPGAPPGLESMVRDIIEKALESFVRNTLPELVRREVGKAQQPAIGVNNAAGIQGNLASFRIVELLQMLGLQRQTGRLSISRAGSENAAIYFQEGAVVYAVSNCSGNTAGIEQVLKKACRLADESLRHALRIAKMTEQPIDAVLAQERILDIKTFADCIRRATESTVYKVMAWRDGAFIFEKVSPPAFANPQFLKVDDLILEGARRSDEWVLVQQRIPDFAAVFEPMIGNAEELTRRGLSDLDIKVFSLVDGKRSVQEIIDLLCLPEFDVAKSMFILLSVNLTRARK